ncbi:MAG: hypothetical protein SFU98_09585 [Leptospiraceae bacterium]|nr:hypothetical protein [Leptospiraceae bacterium]
MGKRMFIDLKVKREVDVDTCFTFFNILNEVTPLHFPDKINNYEPINIPFTSLDKDFLKKFCERTILFKKSSAMDGMISNRKGFIIHSSYKLEYKKNHKKGSEMNLSILSKLIQELSKNLFIEFGYVHELLEGEIEFAQANGSAHRNVILFNSITLQKYIPDLYLCTVIGMEYVQEFGMEKLLSLPVPLVKKLSHEQVYFQLVEDLENFTYEEVKVNREKIKEFLGKDYFFQVSKGRDYKYKRVYKEDIIEPTERFIVITDGKNGMTVVEEDKNKKPLTLFEKFLRFFKN